MVAGPMTDDLQARDLPSGVTDQLERTIKAEANGRYIPRLYSWLVR